MADIDWSKLDSETNNNNSLIDWSKLDTPEQPAVAPSYNPFSNFDAKDFATNLGKDTLGLVDAAASLGSGMTNWMVNMPAEIVANLIGGNALEEKVTKVMSPYTTYTPGTISGDPERSLQYLRPIAATTEFLIPTEKVRSGLEKTSEFAGLPKGAQERIGSIGSKLIELGAFGTLIGGSAIGVGKVRGALRRLKTNKATTNDISFVNDFIQENPEAVPEDLLLQWQDEMARAKAEGWYSPEGEAKLADQGKMVEENAATIRAQVEEAARGTQPALNGIEQRRQAEMQRKNQEARESLQRNQGLTQTIIPDNTGLPLVDQVQPQQTMVQNVPQLRPQQTEAQIAGDINRTKVEDALEQRPKTMVEEIALRNEAERLRKNEEAQRDMQKRQELSLFLNRNVPKEKAKAPEPVNETMVQNVPEVVKTDTAQSLAKEFGLRYLGEANGREHYGITTPKGESTITTGGVSRDELIGAIERTNRLFGVKENASKVESTTQVGEHSRGGESIGQEGSGRVEQGNKGKEVAGESKAEEEVIGQDINVEGGDLNGQKGQGQGQTETRVLKPQEKIEGMILPDEKLTWFSSAEKAKEEFTLNKRSFNKRESAEKKLAEMKSDPEYADLNPEIIKVGEKYRVGTRDEKLEVDMKANDVEEPIPTPIRKTSQEQSAKELEGVAPMVDQWLRDPKTDIGPTENLIRTIGNELQPDHPYQQVVDKMLTEINKKRAELGQERLVEPDIMMPVEVSVDDLARSADLPPGMVRAIKEQFGERVTESPELINAIENFSWGNTSIMEDVRSFFDYLKRRGKEFLSEEEGSLNFDWKTLPPDKIEKLKEFYLKVLKKGKDVVKEMMAQGIPEEVAKKIKEEFERNPENETVKKSREFWRQQRKLQDQKLYDPNIKQEIADVSWDSTNVGRPITSVGKNKVKTIIGPNGKTYEYLVTPTVLYEGVLERLKNTADVPVRDTWLHKITGGLVGNNAFDAFEPLYKTFQMVSPKGRGLYDVIVPDARRATKNVMLLKRDLAKQIVEQKKLAGGHKGLEKIGTYLIGLEKGGIEYLIDNKIRPVTLEELSPKQRIAMENFRSKFDELWHYTNEERVKRGKNPLGYRPDYITKTKEIHNNKDINLALIDDPTYEAITSASEIRNPFANPGGLRSGKPELNIGVILKRYGSKSFEAAEYSPVIDRIHALLGQIKDLKTGNSFKLQDIKPGLAKLLADYGNALAGISNSTTPLDKVATKLTHNVGAALLSFKTGTILNQLGSIRTAWTQLGHRYFMEGLAESMFHPVKSIKRSLSGDHMPVRWANTGDVTFADVLNKLQVDKSTPWGYTKESIMQAGSLLTRVVDFEVANIAWNGAYKKAKAMGMSDAKSKIYADDITVLSNGSSSRGDLSPIQMNALGKMFTAINTFAINEFNWLLRDVGGIGDPRQLGKAGRTNMILRALITTSVMNIVYEELLKKRSPFPSPVTTFARSENAGKSGPEAMWEVSKDLLAQTPVVGNIRYGKSLLGAAVDNVNDLVGYGMQTLPIVDTFDVIKKGIDNQNDLAKIVGDAAQTKGAETLGKLFGVYGSSQVIQYLRNKGKYPEASEWELLVGSPNLYDKRVGPTRSSSGLGGGLGGGMSSGLGKGL